MKQPLFTGVCTALVTPFREGLVSDAMLETLLIRQIRAGVQAVVIAGSTGEAPVLSEAEKLHLFRKAKEIAGRDCLILAGTGSNDTRVAQERSRAAEQMGADGLLVVAPYYNRPTPEGLFLHFQKVAESVEIPIILYNVPSRTGVDIPVSVYSELCRIPNVAGVKEASSDIRKTAEIVRCCGENLPVWCGNDDLIVSAAACGAKGVVSVLSNLLPEETIQMTDLALNGHFREAAAMHAARMPLIRALFRETNPIPVKYGMGRIGFDCGVPRLPLTELSELCRAELDRLLP